MTGAMANPSNEILGIGFPYFVARLVKVFFDFSAITNFAKSYDFEAKLTRLYFTFSYRGERIVKKKCWL